jgi:ABC-type oligopeptide transport system substrate-binding subunit
VFLVPALGEAGIVGSGAVVNGKAHDASGIRAHGRTLAIELTRPDASFLDTLALPLFQAMPPSLPRGRAIESVDAAHGLPSAGPYYVAEGGTNQSLLLRRNRYYRGDRPHHLAAIEFEFGVDAETAYEQVESGAADYALELPDDVHAQLGAEYGTQTGRYRVNPLGCLKFLVLNTSRPLFSDNPELRQAVNFAIDRQAMVEAYDSFFGDYAVSPTDQYVPPGFPGYRDANVYPLDGPDLTRASELAAGNMRSGVARYSAYDSSLAHTMLPVVQASLAKIGIDVQPALYRRLRTSGDLGWGTVCASGPNPSSFLKDVFSERAPSSIVRLIDRAQRLAPAMRLRAFGMLDAQIARVQAPAIAWGSLNDREFFSERVDPRTIVFQPFVGAVDLAALALR